MCDASGIAVTKPASLSRNTAIDALRGIAILLVICFHLQIPYIGLTTQAGVDLFFVLSGFLISGLLLRDYREYGTLRLKRFWVRRAFKILPPLYTYLLVLLVVTWSPRTWNGFLSGVFFCMNYRPVGGMFRHTWSLSVEEQFYLLLPVLLFVLFKWIPKPLNKLPWVLAVIIVAVNLMRIFIPDPGFEHFYNGHFELRADPLFCGVLLRYVHDYWPTWLHKFSRFVLVPGLLFWVPWVLVRTQATSHLTQCLLYTGTVLGCCCLLAWCLAHNASPLWRWIPIRVVAFIGFYSYSIYLWHYPVFNCVNHFNFQRSASLSLYAVGLIGSIALGIGMAKAVELPAIRIRERFQV
jgi:peptidoglycan/LPS O-acetylase OafA/YrhL